MTVQRNYVAHPFSGKAHKLVLLSGHPVRVDKEAAPAGVYDDIREDVRKLSTVKPVDKILVERSKVGYKGVLFSQGTPYLFAMTGTGFVVKEVDEISASSYCDVLEDKERELTADRNAKLADESQEEFNRVMDDAGGWNPLIIPSTSVASEQNAPAKTLIMHGPVQDVIERVPGAYRLATTSKVVGYEDGLAAGGIVVNDEGKVLLVKPSGGYGGYDWTFPKGYMRSFERNSSEGAELTARREVLEESGYECEIERFVTRIEHNDGGVCLYYLLKPVTDRPVAKRDGEVSEVKWATFVEAMELLNDDKDIDVLQRANRAEPKLVIKAEKHTGTMIAVFLPKEVAAKVTLGKDMPADELHVTLAYLGKKLTDDEKDRVREVVRKLAPVTPPMRAILGGIGRFSASESTEGRDVIYLSVDSPDITRFRPILVDALNSAGVSIDETHGFVPHVTLAFIPKEDESPLKRFDPEDVTFTHLTLAVAGERMGFPFRSRMTLKKAAVKRPGSRGGKWWRDDKGTVRYGEKPQAELPIPQVKAAKKPASKPKKKVVAVGKKAAVSEQVTNGFGLTFLRKTSNHLGGYTDIPAQHGKAHGIEGFSEAEIDHFFKRLRASKHKSLDEFVAKEIKPIWDDEEGKNSYTPDKGKEYIVKLMTYLERDGAVMPGLVKKISGTETTSDRDWRKMAQDLRRIKDHSGSSDVPTSDEQRRVRERLRTMVAEFGLTPKAKRISGDKDLSHRVYGDTREGSAAYLTWAGAMGVRPSVLEDAANFAEHMANGTIPSTSMASGMSTLLHEESHGCSNMSGNAYHGGGAVIEEVTTEVTARAMMHRIFGDKKLISGRTVKEAFPVLDEAWLPYQKYIDGVVDAIGEAGVSDGEIVAQLISASFAMKQELATFSPGPRAHVAEFVRHIAGLNSAQRLRLTNRLDAMEIKKAIMDEIFSLKRNDVAEALKLRKHLKMTGQWDQDTAHVMIMLQDDPEELLNAIVAQDAELAKALPKLSDDQRAAKTKKVGFKPVKAATKKVGSGGQVRYNYAGEQKLGAKRKDAKQPKPEDLAAEHNPKAADQEEQAQEPVTVPNPKLELKDPNDQRAPAKHDKDPKHTVNVAELCSALGVSRDVLANTAKRFASNPKLNGRSGFISFMQTHAKQFATEHGLDGDYFGLVFDVLTGVVPEGQPSAVQQQQAQPAKPGAQKGPARA